MFPYNLKCYMYGKAVNSTTDKVFRLLECLCIYGNICMFNLSLNLYKHSEGIRKRPSPFLNMFKVKFVLFYSQFNRRPIT